MTWVRSWVRCRRAGLRLQGSLLAILFVPFIVLLACEQPLPPGDPPAKASRPPSPVRVRMSDRVWAINKAECRWCHVNTPYPARVDLRTQTSVDRSQMQLFYDGIWFEQAPAIHRLGRADKDSMLRWAVQNGARPTPYAIPPPTFFWSMDKQLDGATDGSDATGPGRFFGFDIEDRWIYNADANASTPLKVQTRAYTKNGRTLSFRGIELIKPRLINQDSFPAVYNPSTYIVPAGVPWHGRFKLMRAQGYIKHDRWTSFGVHAFEMEPIGRLQRDYVRFQLDSQGIGMRSYPAVTEAPCIYPDSKLTGNLAICSNIPNIGNDGYHAYWLWMEVEVLRIRPGTLRYTMVVKDPYTGRLGAPSTWRVLASLYGDRADTPDAVGMFFFHKYANSGTLSSAVWAKWEVQVSEIID